MEACDVSLALQLKKQGFNLGFIPRLAKFTTEYETYAKIPLWAIEMLNKKEISRSAFQLYCTILSKCYKNKAFTWISKKKLAEITGMTVRRIYVLLNELVEAGLIAIHTQLIDNVPKSIIFVLSKKNPPLGCKGHIPSDRFILFSGRHAEKLQNKMPENGRSITAKKLHRGTVKRRQSPYCQKMAGKIQEVMDRNLNTKRDETPGMRQDAGRFFSPQVENNSKSKSDLNSNIRIPIYNYILYAPPRGIRKNDIEISKAVEKFMQKYYMWVNKTFNLELTPRPSDYKNIAHLAELTDLDLFFEWIKENKNDYYFLKTNKHASVWTSPLFIGTFFSIYDDQCPVGPRDIPEDWPQDFFTFDEVPN